MAPRTEPNEGTPSEAESPEEDTRSEADQIEQTDNSVREEDGEQPETADDIYWAPKEDD